MEKEISEGKLVEIDYNGPKFFAYAQLIYHKDKWLSPSIKTFLNMAIDELKE